MTTKYAPYDASSYLDSKAMIAKYLTAAAEDDDPRVLMLAIADVAKARGMAHVAEAAGLGRESLYKALAPGAHPRFETIVAVLGALGVKVTVRGATRVGPARVGPKRTGAKRTALKRTSLKQSAPKRTSLKRAGPSKTKTTKMTMTGKTARTAKTKAVAVAIAKKRKVARKPAAKRARVKRRA